MAIGRSTPFRTKNGDANLVECIVAFMDILGVKEMTKGPVKEQLANLRKLDISMREVLDVGNQANFKTSTFSDSIAIVVPLPRTLTERQASLREMLVRCADLQLSLIRNGFFLRGGLTIGRYFHDSHMVYGAGLVDAWTLEDKKAVTPRIVIDQDCQMLRAIVNTRQFDQVRRELLARDHDGSVFVDYLAWAPAFSNLTDVDLLPVHKAVVTDRLAAHKADPGTWQKYRWVAEYHNAAVETIKDEEQAKKLRIEGKAGVARDFDIVKKLESSQVLKRNR